MLAYSIVLSLLSLLSCSAKAQLSANLYAKTCPNLQAIVRSAMSRAVSKEPRMAASILRLFFHDCFVNGCHGSILLDDTTTFTGEKNAFPNNKSARGFEDIDAIKSSVEASCKATVSCADILAPASRDGVLKLGGPKWTVALGQRDATSASQSRQTTTYQQHHRPFPPSSPSSSQRSERTRHDGALRSPHHRASPVPVLPLSHLQRQQHQPQLCHPSTRNTVRVRVDIATWHHSTCTARTGSGLCTTSLLDTQSLVHSDQELFNNGTQDGLVRQYSQNRDLRLLEEMEKYV